MRRNEPCLCGDPYCPWCGGQADPWGDGAVEDLIRDLLETPGLELGPLIDREALVDVIVTVMAQHSEIAEGVEKVINRLAEEMEQSLPYPRDTFFVVKATKSEPMEVVVEVCDKYGEAERVAQRLRAEGYETVSVTYDDGSSSDVSFEREEPEAEWPYATGV